MRWIVVLLVVACSDPQPRLELLEARSVKNVAALVSRELERASHDKKQLLVYVGATWCEPCKYFHDAAVSGQLDKPFGKLRLVVFDADRDGDALTQAGYDVQMIPLFAVPNADGTSSGRQIAGSIKGPGAVAEITPRLEALLAR